jgi:adenosylhomocysteine nucleosidase
VTAVGIFVATRWELDAVRRAFPVIDIRSVRGIRCMVARKAEVDWWIIPMGVGPERAAATAGILLGEHRFSFVWSAGFACALRPARIGDVLLGTQVTMEGGVDAEQPVICAPAMVEWARQVIQPSFTVQAGCFITIPQVLYLAADKQKIAGRTAGIGLDMESGALGLVASKRQIPFGIVRTVSDLVDEDLPLDFNLFLRPSGWARGAAACLAHPTSLIGLNRLRVQSRVAGIKLTALYRAFADQALPAGLA